MLGKFSQVPMLLWFKTTPIHAGMWYHLSLFLDAGELGVAYTGISTATALSQVVGGPLAAALLLLDGTFGLHGWQWLFICEGVPTVLFAVILKVSCLIAFSGTYLHLNVNLQDSIQCCKEVSWRPSSAHMLCNKLPSNWSTAELLF